MEEFDYSCPAIRVLMMPRDTNPQGTIFGGVLLSYIDQAGALEARKHTHQRVVTVAMDEVIFKAPVFVGDVLCLYTKLLRVGRTSLRVKVMVEAERFDNPREVAQVTEATLVFVAVDEDRHPVPVGLPPSPPASDSGKYEI